MLACTGAYELAELKLMDRLGQFGERRQDRRFAKLAMHLVAAEGRSRSGLVRLDEFLLATLDDVERQEESATDQVAAFDRQAGAQWTR